MGILRFPWKKTTGPETPEAVIGILAFEVAGLMSKLVNLWHCLSDKEVMWLKEQVSDSVGIRRFVSEDDDYLMELALEEIIECFGSVSSSVARLSKRCKDPIYHRLERFFDDVTNADDLQWFGWPYRLKKMERKVKKMERFVAATAQLSHEQDVLAELEQSLRRMQANSSQLDRVKLLEFQQRVAWQRQEVKSLRGSSPFGRSHDYVVRLMARSLFTVLQRIKLVFGGAAANLRNSSSNSFSPIADSSVHPSETLTRRERFWNSRSRRHRGGSFSGCVDGGAGNIPIVGGSMRLIPTYTRKPSSSNNNNNNIVHSKLALFNSKSKYLNARASTLGDAGLALRYANVIKLIERLASSPHLISQDARDDLYDMLPSSIRITLRDKLKPWGSSLVYNPSLAAEWSVALAQILEWLAPLAHNTIWWHSERNIERQNEFARTNVFLVMTLYHADQARTEAAIAEMLIGLNYISRVGGGVEATGRGQAGAS